MHLDLNVKFSSKTADYLCFTHAVQRANKGEGITWEIVEGQLMQDETIYVVMQCECPDCKKELTNAR